MAALQKVLAAVLGGRADANIRLDELRRILALGFNQRVNGGHYIYSRRGVIEIINLQPLRSGKAKAYQVKQVRQLITKYGLALPE